MVLKRFFTENLTGGVIAGIGKGRNEKIDAKEPSGGMVKRTGAYR